MEARKLKQPLPRKETKALMQISIPARLKDEVLKICDEREITLSAAGEWAFEQFLAEARQNKGK